MVVAVLCLVGSASGETEYDPLVVVNPVPAVVRTADEAALISDVNIVRIRHGIPTLRTDSRLTEVALSHAENMAARRFFGHTGPDGVDLPARLARAGLQWTVAAENIALDSDEAHANNALVNSSEHLANILDPRVRKIGVAALGVGHQATLYVEDFAL